MKKSWKKYKGVQWEVLGRNKECESTIFSLKKKICLRKMFSIKEISDFHKKILGCPLHKKCDYTSYPWGCQFHTVLWKKNTEENAKKYFSLLDTSKNSLDQTNSIYLCVFLSSTLLVPPKPRPCSLCHLKKDWYDYLIQCKTLQVILNNLFHVMNLYNSVHILVRRKGIALPLLPSPFMIWISLRKIKI